MMRTSDRPLPSPACQSLTPAPPSTMPPVKTARTPLGAYGDIAWRAYCLATENCLSPRDAWQAALAERYTDPDQLHNAIKHTCPRGAFLGLCQAGLLPGIAACQYTRSVSGGYAHAAVELLRANPSLANDRGRLKAQVFGERTPNDEVEVVLAFWGHGLLS